MRGRNEERRENEHRPNDWLMRCARNVTSQAGEDGIIEAVLRVLPEKTGWCVEFGAWDGKHLSNTWNLIENHAYSAVLIEGNSERCLALRSARAENPRIQVLEAFVGFTPDNSLDRLLESTPIPIEFDVLSIDIDGNDYHVWSATNRYRPKLVVIEFNPTIPNEVRFVQKPDPRTMHGTSISSMVELAKDKGYELVATTRFNAFFVEASLFPLFGIDDNSVETLRTDKSQITYMFSGYDGTVFLDGSSRLPWHDFPLSSRAAQQLPSFLRDWKENYNPVQKRLLGLFKRARKLRQTFIK